MNDGAAEPDAEDVLWDELGEARTRIQQVKDTFKDYAVFWNGANETSPHCPDLGVGLRSSLRLRLACCVDPYPHEHRASASVAVLEAINELHRDAQGEDA